MLKRNKYLILRRFTQVSLLALFSAANLYGWKVLEGNYSAAYVMQSFYLSDPFAVLQMLAAGFILNIDIITGAVVTLLLYGLIFGRAFCSWVCPVNIVSDFALYIRRKTGYGRSEDQIRVKRTLRYWIATLAIVVSFFSGVAAFEFVSPVSMMHRGVIFGMGFGLAAVFMIFLFDLFIMKNGWCGHLCPLGGFYALISRYSLIRINHKKENCTMCGNCFAVCPEKQVLSIIDKQSGSIPDTECTNCARCVEVCEDNALKYGILKKLK